MITILTVLRTGGRYDATWVRRLMAGAERAVPSADRFVCLTDGDELLPCERVPLVHHWPGWWAKMEAFRPGLFSGTVILCDLDTVFAGDASALAERDDLTALEDFFHQGRVSSALLRFPAGSLDFIYDAFAADPDRWMAAGSCGAVPNAVHGDQVVLDHLLRANGVLPAFWQSAHPGLVDFYAPAKRAYGPIVVFIGDSKPDKAGEPIASLWRDGA